MPLSKLLTSARYQFGFSSVATENYAGRGVIFLWWQSRCVASAFGLGALGVPGCLRDPGSAGQAQSFANALEADSSLPARPGGIALSSAQLHCPARVPGRWGSTRATQFTSNQRRREGSDGAGRRVSGCRQLHSQGEGRLRTCRFGRLMPEPPDPWGAGPAGRCVWGLRLRTAGGTWRGALKPNSHSAPKLRPRALPAENHRLCFICCRLPSICVVF